VAKDLEYYLAQARRIAKHREAGAEQEIRELYQTMLKDLQQFISDVYVRYARNDRLTLAELQAAGYDARFLEEIEQRLNLSTPRASRALRLLVEQTYSAAWSGMIEGVTNASSELGTAFADSVAITPEQIRRAVENPVYGLTLKDTLEKNRRDIIYSIKQTIGVTPAVSILGYIQRGGAPSGRDRVSAAMMGVRAIDVLKSDATSRVIVERNGRFEDMDIEEALQMKRELDEEMFIACNRIDTSYQYHHKKNT